MADNTGKATGGLIGLVLITILGVAYLPRQGTESKSASETNASATNKGSGSETQSSQDKEPVAECQEIFDHIKRFYPEDEYYPRSCFPHTNPDLNVPANPPAYLRFVIAIVPNPVQTHLPLLFDRSVEAIQQAAQDEGYTYDGSWFPWDDSSKNRDANDDEEIAKDLEEKGHRQPGVLVFRRDLNLEEERRRPYSGGLVVFLVGEQPTGGIDDIQFEHAMQWLNTLQHNTSGETLRILGPTFSGSLPSLARELQSQVVSNSWLLPTHYDGIKIYSGSVSSHDGIQDFGFFLQSLADKRNSLLPIDAERIYEFRTFSESDTVMTNRFLCYLSHAGYELDRVAILSEGQTAFGSQTGRGRLAQVTATFGLTCGSRVISANTTKLYYPRDIASLRSAYEKQSIFSAGKQQASGNAPTTTLHGDLSESPSSEHDAVRSYARQLTPLNQEAVLFGITNILDNKHIEFVILRGSNTLDLLFLSEFLRRSYPGVRVVIDGSDLLLRRGMEGASLRGIMLLSTYPLIGWTQDAAPVFLADRAGSYRVFAQDSTEGLYIAARKLFPTAAYESVPIVDYAPPAAALKGGDENADDNRPATWLSVVGHRQFWPLAVLNSNTEQAYGPSDESLLDPENATAESRAPSSARLRVHLPGEMVGLLALSLMLGLWHLYCCCKGSIIGSPRVRAYFAPIPRIQHLVLIFTGSLLVGLLGVVLAFSMYYGLTFLTPISAVLAVLTVVVLVVFSFLACLANSGNLAFSLAASHDGSNRIARGRRWATVVLVHLAKYSLPVLSPDLAKEDSKWIKLWRPRVPWLWPLLLIVLALLYYTLLFSHLDTSNQYATFWRGVYLRSGVSGLLPQVLLLLGLYAWFWFTLQGLSLFGADRPVLPRTKDLPQLDVRARFKIGKEFVPGHKFDAFRMFSREDASDPTEDAALPLTTSYLRSLAIFLLVTVAASWLALGEFGLRSLGDRRFGRMIFFGACLCIAMILADALQFLRTWSRLRQLLIYLDRLRLRRTLKALKGLSWDSVWKMSGNVLEQRYLLISRQLESMRNLTNLLDAWKPTDQKEIDAKNAALTRLKTCATKGTWFADWYVGLCDLKHHPSVADVSSLQEFQDVLAATAACVMKQIILPAWNKESESQLIEVNKSEKAGEDKEEKDTQHADHSPDPHKPWVQAAEEFFVLPYLGFIQNTIGRMRSMAMTMLVLFVAATLAVSSYPFDPLPVIGAIFLITFVLLGVIVIFVYAEMHRDATLSRITNTDPGKLGLDFWVKLVTFGIGPLIGLLTTLFPSMTDFIVSFVQPGAQSIK